MKKDFDIYLFEDLLQKYKFTNPVPDKVQDRMLHAKSDIFIKILKTIGKFTLVYWLFYLIYFMLKKAGILYYSKILITVAVIGVGSSGSYVLYKYITSNSYNQDGIYITEHVDRNKVYDLSDIQKIDDPNKVNDAKPEHQVGIISFTSSTLDKAFTEKITKTFFDDLSEIKGKKFAQIFNGKATGVKYAMFGSIEHLNGKYMLTVKAVDLKTSGIVYINHANAETIETLEKKFPEIALELSGKISK